MSIDGQSGEGKIVLFDDFCGPEIPIANAKGYGATGGGCAQYLGGPFKITGDVVNTDSGAPAVAKSNGYLRIIGSANADADGIAVGTEVCFSPLLNGPLILETRVEMNELTTKNVFIGFAGANADTVLEPLTSLTATITYVTPVVGFHLDSTITNPTYWHTPYLLATTATQTETSVLSSQIAVAQESDVLRVEIDSDGAARWYINGVLEQSVGAGLAATPATLLAGMVGVWAKSTAVGIDIDYLLVKANRDWTR